MAIDVSPVKSSVSSDGKFQPANNATSSGSGGIDFAKLMRGTGIRVSNRLMAISDKAGISSITDRADLPTGMDERQKAPIDDRPDNYDNSERHTERARDQDNPPPTNRQDDHIREPAPTVETGRSETVAENSAQSDHGRSDDVPAEHQQNSGKTETTDPQSTTDDTASTEEDATGQAAATGEQASEPANSQGENSAQGKTPNSNAEQILQSLLATAQSNTAPGKSTDQTAGTAQKSGPVENAVNGLNNALANATKANENAAATNGQNTAGAETGGKNTTAKHAGQATQANTGNGAQTTNTAANVQNQAAIAETTGKEAAAQQSAQLSKMVGKGAKVSVAVETIDDKATLVSKPASSLASSAALIGQNNGRSGRGHQAPNTLNTTTGQTQTNSAQASLAQATTASTATQGQAAATGGDIKGLVLANRLVATAGPVSAGTGEGNPATASATAANINSTPQAQSIASSQASSAPRFAQPGQALTDQVTVQITKALNAGVDKISIQLKPADLGRIDVKLEIGHDGRVTAVVTADNKNTLDLLQRDSKELQQALQDAGMQLDNDSLSFNLREQHEQGENTQTAGTGFADEGGEAADDGGEDQMTGTTPDIISKTRVDIRA